jgi:hypothetical protein
MLATDKFDSMMSALAHAADLRNSHREKNKGFNAPRILGDAVRIEKAFNSLSFFCFQQIMISPGEFYKRFMFTAFIRM